MARSAQARRLARAVGARCLLARLSAVAGARADRAAAGAARRNPRWRAPAVTGSIAQAARTRRRRKRRARQPQPTRSPIRSPPCSASPAPTAALTPEQRALVDTVSTYLSERADADRQLRPGRPRRPPHARASSIIQKPGKVRFEYDPPSPIELIADGPSVVVRDRKLATQDLYPLSQTPLRFLLADHIDLMQDTNLVAVSADDVFVTVVIEEKNALVGTSRLMMMFSAKDMQLKQWTVTDPQGYDTTVAVYNLDTSKTPDPNMFRIDYTQYRQLSSSSCAPSIAGLIRQSTTVVTGARLRGRLTSSVAPCPSPSPPGTSIRCGCASIWSRKFIKAARPDVLCLQETKCPDDAFPLKRFKRLGYEHVALNGQKGYHGVAVLSRCRSNASTSQNFCGKTDCRHISVVLGEQAGLRDPITLHNFYVPAGGDEPDPADQSEIRAQARLPRRDARRMPALRPAHGERAILVGDLNVAPLEHDVWSHKQMLKVVSHTPIECEKLDRRAEGRRLDRHDARAHAGAGEALHVVELPRDGQLGSRRPRPPARPHLDVGRARRPRLDDRDRQGLPRLRSARPTTCR